MTYGLQYVLQGILSLDILRSNSINDSPVNSRVFDEFFPRGMMKIR